MSKLKDEELIGIEGGSIKAKGSIIAAIGGAIVFIIGVVNGLLRPSSCSAK